MSAGRRRNFLRGLGTGLAGSLIGAGAVLYVLSRNKLVSFSEGLLPDPSSWLAWAYTNLGSSIPVFAGLLLAYAISSSRLRRSLERDAPIERIVQLDHLTDIWTALFFGTGVIWTAIGMRSALIHALGDPDSTVKEGAFAVLQRLVDGGILVALSTTIFGGVGGYLMRVYKSVSIGSALQQRYDRAARVDTVSIRDTLHRIEARLSGRRSEPAGADP